MSSRDTENLARYFEEKIARLMSMEKLSNEQIDALKSDSLEQLCRVLEEKESLAQEVDQMDQKIDPLYQNLSSHERSRYAQQIQTCRTILSRLIHLEKESTERAQKELSFLQKEVSQIRNGSRALKGYKKSDSLSTSRFLDLKNG